MRWAAILLLLAAIPATAQVRPVAGAGDPRLQTVAYDPNQVVQLEVASEYQVTIAFAADERIENVAIGDASAWQVTPNRRGDHVFVKANAAGGSTNLTVVTDVRTYSFELVATAGPSAGSPFVVRFTYPSPGLPAAQPATSAAPEQGRYHVSGATALRPAAISDDGTHTYIQWPNDVSLPAVFAIDDRGAEILVDGYMRDGFYTIDAVRRRLLFRLDRKIARADRVEVRNP